jgi:hypothetical protein
MINRIQMKCKNCVDLVEPYGYIKLSNGKFYHELEGIMEKSDKSKFLPLYEKHHDSEAIANIQKELNSRIEQIEYLESYKKKLLNSLYHACSSVDKYAKTHHPDELQAILNILLELREERNIT